MHDVVVVAVAKIEDPPVFVQCFLNLSVLPNGLSENLRIGQAKKVLIKSGFDPVQNHYRVHMTLLQVSSV